VHIPPPSETTPAVPSAEDLLVEVRRPRKVRGRHLDVADLSIRKRGAVIIPFRIQTILRINTWLLNLVLPK
jgi:hypothetical protein